jgi:integrase/recombinase XerD
LKALERLNYAPRTRTGYAAALALFAAWCAEREVRFPAQLTPTLLAAWQRHLHSRPTRSGRPASLSQQCHHLVALRSFCRWAYVQGHLLLDPAVSLSLPRLPETLPRYTLSVAEIEAVLAQADFTTPLGLRDRAMLEVLYATALRSAELVALKLHDLEPERGLLRIEQGKGRRDRYVPLTPRALLWLKHYLKEGRERLTRRPVTSTVLFLSQTGRALQPLACSNRLARYVSQALPKKRGSCHLLRHSVATLLLENGCDLRHVQELLGHRQIGTTQRYTRVAVRDLKAAYLRHHPAQRAPVVSPSQTP